MHGVQFLVICEPKLGVSKIESIRLRIAFDFVMVNRSADLWVFYMSPFACSLIGSSDQHITLDVSHPLLSTSLVLSWVHAGSSVKERKDLWAVLLRDKPQVRPWCIGGDFNGILAPSEKRGVGLLLLLKGWILCHSWK